MNIADLAFFGFPSDFTSFFNFVLFLTNSCIELIFIVWFFNALFSMFYEAIMKLGGVKR